MEGSAATTSRTDAWSRCGRLICMVEIGSQSSGAARECNDSFCFADEDFDFPPTVYPGRELFAFGLFVFAIITSVVWGGWHLFLLILTALI
jgi:hypothetical protein